MEHCWIVDPIDGTSNLIVELPFVALAVAQIDKDGLRLAAVIGLDQKMTDLSARGCGAYMAYRGKPMRKMAIPPTAPELIVMWTGGLDVLFEQDEADAQARWAQLRAIGKLRNLGSQALHLCGVAIGQFAAIASIDAKIWDEAAAGLILRKAGGVWQSRADLEDWRLPSRMMQTGSQRSFACHQDVRAAVETALADLVTLGFPDFRQDN